MRDAERSTEAHRQEERPADAPRAAAVPPLLALQQAGVGNHALSRWLLQREQTYEEAAAELRGIDTAALAEPSTAELRAQINAELADWEPTGDAMAQIDAIERRRKQVDARLRAQVWPETLPVWRQRDAAERLALDAREAAAKLALSAAHTAATAALAGCRKIQDEYQQYPYMEHDPLVKATMEEAKGIADERAARLLPIRGQIPAARTGVADAVGSEAKKTAIAEAEIVAREAAAAAKAATGALKPHQEALARYTARATVPERTALKAAAVELGLPGALANKILSIDLGAPVGDIQERLTTKREEHQSVAGPTIVTSVFGMGVTHRGANTCGIDNVGTAGGKRVHLTLFWDQVTAGPISLNQTDATILDKVLGTGATTCMHVTAEVYGGFHANNPSYFWKGATKKMGVAAPTLGMTAAELETAMKAICAAKVKDFTDALKVKRAELGARDPTPPPPPNAPPPPPA